MIAARWSARELFLWSLYPAVCALIATLTVAGPTLRFTISGYVMLMPRAFAILWFWPIAGIWFGALAAVAVLYQARQLSRRYGQGLSPKWMLATAAGIALAIIVCLAGIEPGSSQPKGLFVAFAAFSLPAVQYLALRETGVTASYWLLWSGLGWLGAAVLFTGLQGALLTPGYPDLTNSLAASLATFAGCLASGLALSHAAPGPATPNSANALSAQSD